MNRFTDGSFSCSCLSIRWFFPFGSAGRCTQSLSSLLGVVLGFCIVWATTWIISIIKEGPPKKGRRVRDSPKKKNYIAHTHHFVAPLCVVKGEKQSFGGKVRPHPVGGQSSSTRMISTSSVILLLQVCPTNYLSLAMIRTVPLDVSRTIRSRNHSIKRWRDVACSWFGYLWPGSKMWFDAR